MTDIEKLNELYAKTTQGEWSNDSDSEYVWFSESHDLICDCRHRDCPREENSNAAWIAAIHNAWPEIAADLKVLADVRNDLPRLYATAKEWQEYSEKIEIEADAAMAEEIQRLRRECPKAINKLKDAECEIARLRERVAELEYDPRLSVHWIRGIANVCKEAAERQQSERRKLDGDDSRKAIVESAMSIGREDVYSTMHVELSRWADKFRGHAPDVVDEIERLKNENNELRTQLRIQWNASRD